jgi:tRNA-dihydrouridine synthase B
LSNDLSRFAEPLRIGPVEIPNRAFLAPMSGVTDLPFRRMAARYGAGLVVSEMIACESTTLGSEEARLRVEGEGLAIHVVQLAGREPSAMANGVRIAEAAGASIVDINMGCPAKRVTSGYAGSALMRDVDLALRIIEATVGTASVPVTLKMRLGWDERSLNAADLAAKAEAAGVQLITVHGRTRCQFYHGWADWAAIRGVKDAVSVPVVANGDLVRAEDAPKMLAASGADAVMIGRGACGQPWLVGQTGALLAGHSPGIAPEGADLLEHVIEHYEAMLDYYPAGQGFRIARKHLGWYLERAGAPAGLRQAILTGSEPKTVMRLVRAALADAAIAAAA